MRPKGLAIAKMVAKVSVLTDTAVGKKSVARRSSGLDYSSQSSSVRKRGTRQALTLWAMGPTAKRALKICAAGTVLD
jgi:hypothetical protein